MYKIKIEQFEGPLDLLLQLIEEQELDITQISLGKVTDQYINMLDQAEEISPGELADFLVIAAKLLLIKSKVLLPYLSPDEEDLGSDLERQLKMYKLYHEASKVIQKMILKKKFTYYRESSKTLECVFVPPKGISGKDLCGFFKIVLKQIEPIIKIPEEALHRTISIKEKITQIKEHIIKSENLSFKGMVSSADSKTEIIVTFLALLELIKQKNIAVVQDNIFSEITIKKVNDR